MQGASLKGRTAVVTGASSGIGRAIALAFAAAGCDVVVNFRASAARAAEVVAAIRGLGVAGHALQADVGDPRACVELVARSCALLGTPDIWVNNAGADILTGAGAGDDDADKLQHLLQVDLGGTIHCCWAVAPRMQEAGRGVILNMSWDLAVSGLPGRNAQMFAAAKAGVLGFSRALARDVAPRVRVNVLAPGWIRTAFAEQSMPPAYFEQRRAEIPLGRFGEVADVAAAAVYLASDEARYVTGQVLNVNGGLV